MINSEILLKLSQICRAAADKEEPPIPAMLPRLKEAGYQKVRYYEVTPDEDDQPEYLILAGWEDDEQKRPGELRSVHIDDAFVRSREANQLAIRRSANEEDEEKGYSEADNRLGIAARNNIHIPILIGDKLFFEICLSKPVGIEVTDEELNLFSVLGKTISNYYYARSTRRINSAVKRHELTMQEAVAPWNETVQRFANAAATLVDAKIASHFQFGFHQQKLQKIGADIRAKGIRPVKDEIKETYQPGLYLTGQAATRDSYGNDQAPICRNAIGSSHNDENKNPSYYSRYRNVLGGEFSVIYLARHGELSIDLVRLMIPHSDPIGAFTMEDSFVLRRLRARCDGVLKRSEFSHQANILREFNLHSLKSVSDLKGAFAKLKELVGGNNIVEIGAMVGRQQNSHFSKFVFTGDTVIRLFGDYLRQQSTSGEFVEKVAKNTICFMRMDEFCKSISCPNKGEPNLGSVIIIDSSNSDLKIITFIFLRVDITGKEKNIITAQLKKFLEDLGIATTYAANAAESHVGIENAQRLMGQIGHELFPVVMRVHNVGSKALYRLNSDAKQRVSKEFHDEMDAFVIKTDQELDKALMAAQRNLDIAISMSQGDSATINVTFEKINLGDMIDEIANQLITYDLKELQADGVSAHFVMNGATRKLGDIVADRYMLERILVNVMRNALKYSIPYQGNPIEIKVMTNPQPNWVDIRVENWGSAIPPDDMDYIFDPFYRGNNLDRKRARRGIGLGLFIANRFAQVHDGYVKCEGSVPTFDDVARRKSEGHNVTFVIRLSRTISDGTAKYIFKGRK